YAALLVLGLIFLAYMSPTSLPRTLLLDCFDLLLGTIGTDNMTGHFRYSLEIAELVDGIGIVPVAIALIVHGRLLSSPSAIVGGAVAHPQPQGLAQPVGGGRSGRQSLGRPQRGGLRQTHATARRESVCRRSLRPRAARALGLCRGRPRTRHSR